jgi:hypothetical protein
MIGLCLFVALSLAVKFQFGCKVTPRGMVLISIMSPAGVVAFVFLSSVRPQSAGFL